ncbi:MAG: CPBP family intramembrane metalloprotease [Chloroflexi bacterium]|nr:CPBP family intramembrane metalloprotease [Chloroflexota bacterium]
MPSSHVGGPTARSSRIEKRATPFRRTASNASLNPRFTFLLYAAMAIGTFQLERALRVTILWVTLVVLILAHVYSRPLQMRFTLKSIRAAAILGMVLTLPLGLIAREPLVTLASGVFGDSSGLVLFERTVMIAAPIEEVYFRGCVQRDVSLMESAFLYALGMLLLYLPAVQGFWIVLSVVVIGSALLGLLWTWSCQRWGPSAAIACHAVCNLCLFVVPGVLHDWASQMYR